ncbi:MAG: hypothetical protein IJU40_07560 [Desulfovibrionaceae bacterium]|nr:hypothetical protein [Desulfovibrionaceae bacterium]
MEEIRLIKYPHIGAIEIFLDEHKDLQEFDFIGSVKIHGTNNSVCYKNGNQWTQAKNHIITTDKEAYGFNVFVKDRKKVFDEFFTQLMILYPGNQNTYAIYGEFFGKNIQADTAASQVKRSYAIFDITIIDKDNNRIIVPLNQLKTFSRPEYDIYCIYNFETLHIKGSMNDLDNITKQIDAFNNKVYQHCPVGNFFGIDGEGEGVVWTHFQNNPQDKYLKFKTKGEKYKLSRVNKDNSYKLDVLKDDLAKIQAFIPLVFTENRIKQGLQETKDQRSFVRWMTADIMREERVSIAHLNLSNNGLLAHHIAQKAETAYLEYNS